MLMVYRIFEAGCRIRELLQTYDPLPWKLLTRTVPIFYKYYSVRASTLYLFCLQLLNEFTASNEEYTLPRTSQRTFPYLPFSSRISTNTPPRVKKYGLTMLVSADDQVKAYIKKIMSQLDKWMVGGKISKLVVVITSKDTGEHVERWQFDVR